MMPATLQLAISTLWRKPVKPLLTALVITAAVALVMTACSVLSSMRASLQHNLASVLGQVDARITPITQGRHSAGSAREGWSADRRRKISGELFFAPRANCRR